MMILRCFLLTASFAMAQPNVVIFYTDDQGTLDANCYGSTDLHTPTMDRLAADGVRFTQAYAHTVCCPSRAALLTGRHPQRSGINNWVQGRMDGPKGINLPAGELTFAEFLKNAGYKTALFGKWHLGAHPDHGPDQHGFDQFFGIRGGFIDNYNHHFLHGRGFHDLYEGTAQVFRNGEYFPEMITRRSLEFIESNHKTPFLLFLSFNIPHYPEQPRAEDLRRYEHLPMARRSYAAMISTTDHYMGLVMAKLDELELTENTLVIFQSDNGHSTETNDGIRFDDHASGLPVGHHYLSHGGGSAGKWRGSKGTFFEGGIRVPAVVSWPAKLPKGIKRDQAITIMDWYPSLLEWCGIENPGLEFDGKSLQAIIDSTGAPSAHQVLHFQWGNSWAVRRGDWKLIGTDDTDGKRPTSHSLYNLADAEPEAKDYAAEMPGMVEELAKLHHDWLREVTPPQEPAEK